MKKEDCYEIIDRLKKEIEYKLTDLDIYKIKDLILWLLQSNDYQNVKKYDAQLMLLDFFVSTWRLEKGNMNSFEMQGDIFYGVSSLTEIEEKYLCAKFAILRLEMNLPYEYCVDMVDRLIAYQYSAYALFSIILQETKDCENNICKLAEFLKDRNELVKSIGLLQKGIEEYPQSQDLKLILAETWMSIEQWEKAYECLQTIEQPCEEVFELKQELEIVVKNENV